MSVQTRLNKLIGGCEKTADYFDRLAAEAKQRSDNATHENPRDFWRGQHNHFVATAKAIRDDIAEARGAK